MYHKSHFYKFHVLEELGWNQQSQPQNKANTDTQPQANPKNADAAFYRFDSKLFYIIRRNGANSINVQNNNGQTVHAGNALVNAGLSQRFIPYTNEQRFSLPEGLLIRDCILKKPIRQSQTAPKSSSKQEKAGK